jgi:hypothetical protein
LSWKVELKGMFLFKENQQTCANIALLPGESKDKTMRKGGKYLWKSYSKLKKSNWIRITSKNKTTEKKLKKKLINYKEKKIDMHMVNAKVLNARAN